MSLRVPNTLLNDSGDTDADPYGSTNGTAGLPDNPASCR